MQNLVQHQLECVVVPIYQCLHTLHLRMFSLPILHPDDICRCCQIQLVEQTGIHISYINNNLIVFVNLASSVESPRRQLAFCCPLCSLLVNSLITLVSLVIVSACRCVVIQYPNFHHLVSPQSMNISLYIIITQHCRFMISCITGVVFLCYSE